MTSTSPLRRASAWAASATGTQWYDRDTIESVNSQKVYDDIDTIGRQSGSAVYCIVDGDRFGVAVHAY